MDYSNESFERFQQTLKLEVEEESLLWQLRDALFAEAFYGKKRKFPWLYSLPFGWLLVLAFLWIQSWRNLARRSIPISSAASHHFLFLSERNNHTARLLPLYREIRKSNSCAAWYNIKNLGELAQLDERDEFKFIAGEWTIKIRFQDIYAASRLSKKLAGIFPEDLTKSDRNTITIYLVEFFAWQRFWESTLDPSCQYIASTFEKSSIAKAFFYVAHSLDAQHRIHWIHGLRHASLQSTLASELWCMTPGDVRFFEKCLPIYCTAHVKGNPEAAELAATISVLDPASLRESDSIHFLFLGPGEEKSYTKDMRMSDLAIIKSLQQHFNSRIQWRFRPHPSATDRFRKELIEAGITIEDFSSGHLHDDLKWAHAIGSSWSSLLLDVRATGRPIFWIQSEIRNLGAVDELIEDGIGVHLDATTGVDRLQQAFPTLGRYR